MEYLAYIVAFFITILSPSVIGMLVTDNRNFRFLEILALGYFVIFGCGIAILIIKLVVWCFQVSLTAIGWL